MFKHKHSYTWVDNGLSRSQGVVNENTCTRCDIRLLWYVCHGGLRCPTNYMVLPMSFVVNQNYILRTYGWMHLKSNNNMLPSSKDSELW